MPGSLATMDLVTPEIWSYIFSFVRRDPPPPFKSRTEWDDLHQHDLITLSRVSSSFHQLAIPYLYTSVVANGLPLFLAHLDDAPSSLSAKITSKRDRIKLIRHFRIAALGPPFRPRWTMHQLLAGERAWVDVGEIDIHATFRRLSGVRDELDALFRTFRAYARKKPISMPVLESAIIGQMGRYSWEQIFNVAINLPVHDEGQRARRLVAYFLLDLDPRAICCHTAWSPYTPLFSKISLKGKLTKLCTHHYSQFGSALVGFFPGKINRHYFDPRANATPILPDRDHGIDELIDCVTVLDQSGRKDVMEIAAKTKFELLGYCALPVATTPVAEENIRLFGRRINDEVIPGEAGFRQGEEDEKVISTLIMDNVLGKVSDHWKSQISITPWAEVPLCEACGWTTEDIPTSKEFFWRY